MLIISKFLRLKIYAVSDFFSGHFFNLAIITVTFMDYICKIYFFIKIEKIHHQLFIILNHFDRKEVTHSLFPSPSLSLNLNKKNVQLFFSDPLDIFNFDDAKMGF